MVKELVDLDKLKLIYNAIDEKFGENIKIIDVREITTLTDYFVITNGKNSKQIDGICEGVKNALGKISVFATNVEGYGSNWTLMDYNFAFIHVFSQEERENYELERLWSDGEFLSAELFV